MLRSEGEGITFSTQEKVSLKGFQSQVAIQNEELKPRLIHMPENDAASWRGHESSGIEKEVRMEIVRSLSGIGSTSEGALCSSTLHLENSNLRLSEVPRRYRERNKQIPRSRERNGAKAGERIARLPGDDSC